MSAAVLSLIEIILAAVSAPRSGSVRVILQLTRGGS